MMKRPGEEARLTIDMRDRREIDEGDVLFSPTMRRYLVIDAHESSRTPHRWFLKTVVMAADDEPPIGARAVHFVWNSRG